MLWNVPYKLNIFEHQNPVVQSVVSLTSSLMVKMLTSSKYNTKFTGIFAEKKISANIFVYMLYLMIKVLTIRLLTTSLVLNNWAQNALQY